MVPIADEKEHSQRRNSKGRRRKQLVTIGHLALHPEILTKAALAVPEFGFFRKWGCPVGELIGDPEGSRILSRLYRVWPRLSADQRRLYLETAERIAEAEMAKIAWNPKTSRRRYIRLAKNAVAAAKFAQELSLMFPPPWVREEAKIGELVFGLASFISGSVMATFPWDRDTAVHNASALLRTAKKKIARKAGGMRWELVRDLVWLASRKSLAIDERTVRRYLEKQDSAKNPIETYLRPNWDLFFNVYGLAKQWRAHPDVIGKLGQPECSPELGTPNLDSESFRPEALNYLTNPRVSDSSPENPA